MTIQCSKCGIEKPEESFAKRSDRPRGRASRCKECQRSKPCADCGKPVTRYATYCMDCRFKGDRNPIAGTTRPEHVRAAVGRAHAGVQEKPRPRRKPTTPASGRSQANSLYAKPDRCERCGERKRLDWHHINGDATDNRRENLSGLCRRCHQMDDGRHDFLRTTMPRMGRHAQLHATSSSNSEN